MIVLVANKAQKASGSIVPCGKTATAVIAPVWERFLSAYPDVDLEVSADEASVDLVAMGFDAGTELRALMLETARKIELGFPASAIARARPTTEAA